jgi:hypothetical protein
MARTAQGTHTPAKTQKIVFGRRQQPYPTMDVLVVAAAMEFEKITALTAPSATPAPMETASPAGSKRATIGVRETKAKETKKVLTRRGREAMGQEQESEGEERRDSGRTPTEGGSPIGLGDVANANAQVSLPPGLAEAMRHQAREECWRCSPVSELGKFRDTMTFVYAARNAFPRCAGPHNVPVHLWRVVAGPVQRPQFWTSTTRHEAVTRSQPQHAEECRRRTCRYPATCMRK